MKLAVAIYCSDSGANLWNLTHNNKNEYCVKHGYNLVKLNNPVSTNFDISWARIEELIKILPKYDYILFQGLDTLIMNYNIKIEDWINKYKTHDFIIGFDVNGLNNDVMLVKNTDWSIEYLKYILEQKYKNPLENWEKFWWNEQKAMERSYLNHPLQIRRIPQKSFNSYHYPYYERPETTAGQFTEGDWILHFPGMSMEKRLEEMPKWLDKVVK